MFPSGRYDFQRLDGNDRIEIQPPGGGTPFTFPGFASVAGVVAALVAGIVLIAGLAATMFLASNASLLRAGAAAVLTILFTFAIAALVPRSSTTLHRGTDVVLQIRQTAVFPGSVYTVLDPAGATVAALQRPLSSRLGPERWDVLRDGRTVAEAREDSRGAFVLRALFGMFSRRWRPRLRLTTGGIDCAVIRRDPRKNSAVEITSTVLDPRIAIALGIVVIGRER